MPVNITRGARPRATAALILTAALIAGGVVGAIRPVAVLPLLSPGASSLHASPRNSAPDSLGTKADSLLIHAARSGAADRRPRVIVRFAASTPPRERQTLLQRVGAQAYRRLDLIRSVAARVPVAGLAALAALPQVERLSADAGVRKTDDFTVPRSGADIAAASPYSGGFGLTGKGVGVAILDSGIRPVQDFNTVSGSSGATSSRVIAAASFLSGSTTPNDQLGHGTHVAGIVAGNGAASSGTGCFRTFYGIARQANLVNVRVLDDKGNGLVSDVISGINWVIQNKDQYNIRVLNISLGHPVYESYQTDPLNQAVEAAWRSGVVVVCSAGNSGRLNVTQDANLENEGWGAAYGSILVPGNDPYVITVGATKKIDAVRTNDRIATYSSRGPTRLDMVIKPDIIAPGNRVISVLANNSTLDNADGGTNDIPWSAYSTLVGSGGSSAKYFVLSGTSMAAPVVSGAAALLIQKDPTLTPDTVKARLMLTADKWASANGNTDPFTYGAGYLNIPGALLSTVVVPVGYNALSPTVFAALDGNLYVNMNQAIWGKAGDSKAVSLWYCGIDSLQAVYGSSALWNGNILTDFLSINGGQAIWGKANSVQSNQAIWGKATSLNADVSNTAVYGD